MPITPTFHTPTTLSSLYQVFECLNTYPNNFDNERFRKLVSEVPDINAPSYDMAEGESLLCTAVMIIPNDDDDVLKIVSSLYEANADINAQDVFDESGLSWAIQSGHPNVASFLLKNNAMPDTTNSDDRTPLHLALSKYPDTFDLEFIALLIGANTDITAKDKNEITPLDLLKTIQSYWNFSLKRVLKDK